MRVVNALLAGLLVTSLTSAQTGVETTTQGRVVTVTTSFEMLNDTADDQPNASIGVAEFGNGGVVGTRGFPPGYRTGAFVWITPATSTISFSQKNICTFFAKNIIELNNNQPFAGILRVTYFNGRVQNYSIPNAGWGQFLFANAREIRVLSDTAAPSNIDDFAVRWVD